MSSGKVSTTGYIIASSLVKLARLPEYRKYFTEEMILFNAAFARYAKDSLIKRWIDSWSPGFTLWVMDSFFVPGLMQYYIFRKRFIEERVIDSIVGGVRQVINLGAGFDTLVLRLAKEYPAVRFFEVDLPNTQTVKIDVLGRIEYAVPSNCHFIAADLMKTNVRKVLASENGISPGEPTLIVLEGVLMHLAQAAVSDLFADLSQCFQAPLTVVFGATVTSFGAMIASREQGNWCVRAINSVLGRCNEDAKWYCPSQDMAGFVVDRGFALKEWVAYKKLQSQYRSDSEIRDLPDENENYYVIEKIRSAGNIDLERPGA